MTSYEYIEKAKKKINVKSDYEMAKVIGVKKQALSNYKRKISFMDDYAAYQIAEILEINPMEIIATANAERERNEERKKWWEKISESYASGLARTPSVLLGLTLFGEVFNFGKCILCKIASKVKKLSKESKKFKSLSIIH